MNRSEFLSAEIPRAAETPAAAARFQDSPLDRNARAAWAEHADRVVPSDRETRIDPPHGRSVAPPLAPSTTASPVASRGPSVSPAAAVDETREAEMAARESLLRLHAADLIERLQVWSSDLDARESQINSRAALQDHRERQFRLWAQSRRADLEDSIRAAEERAEELCEAARRLTLAELTQRIR